MISLFLAPLHVLAAFGPDFAPQELAEPQASPGPPVEAGPVPHAGDDRVVELGAEFHLDGRIDGLSPLDFWMADGNGPAEDRLVRFSSEHGQSVVGPLRRLNGETLGWPGDLVRIDGRVYGIDVGRRYVYILDEKTGICLPVTPPLPKQWSLIQSLAYDAEEDRLFAVDLQTGQLLHIARGSGVVTPRRAPELTGRKGVRSLAFDPALRLLFAADYETDRLLVIEPETGHLSDSMVLRSERGGRIEELQFFRGELYAMRGLLRKGELVGAQLQRINLRTGTIANVGPRIPDVSPHALLVNSVPEDHRWAQVGGPATAAIDFTRGLDTAVVFPVVGRYEFELRVGDAVDRVTVEVVAVGASTGDDERDGAHSLPLRQVREWTPFGGRSLAPMWRLGGGSHVGASPLGAETEVFVWRRGYDGPCGDRVPVAGVAVAARR